MTTRPFKPAEYGDRKPRLQTPPEVKPVLNGVVFALYAGEAGEWLELPSLAVTDLDNNARYARFRRTVREMYGADFYDVNFFDTQDPTWRDKVGPLERWLLRAGLYGSPGLYCLGIPTAEQAAAIERACEAAWRLKINVHLYVESPEAWQKFVRSATLVHLTRSKTTFRPSLDLRGIQASLSGVVDRFAARLGPEEEFEVGPVSASFERRSEVLNLITNAGKGRWPELRRITLLAGKIQNQTWRTIPAGSELSYLNTQAFGLR